MAKFGTIIAQLLTSVVDGPDADDVPDEVPLTGTVTFTLNVTKIIEAAASPNPRIWVPSVQSGVLDSGGYLCTPLSNGLPGARGLKALATNDPDLNPVGMQYTVSYNVFGPGNKPLTIASHTMVLPFGSVVDLALIIPPASAPAIGTAAAEAAAAIAVAAAQAAQSVVAGFIVLQPGQPVPAGTPSGTVIVRAL